MRSTYSALAAALLLLPMSSLAGDLEGPARFCGYSPVIDLLPGEKITTLGGGIHGGSFRWEGPFGSSDVQGIGWAAPPKGRMLNRPSTDKPAIFAPRRVKQGYRVAIWNGAHATAYFTSLSPFRAAQIAAIKRVSPPDEVSCKQQACSEGAAGFFQTENPAVFARMCCDPTPVSVFTASGIRS